MKRTLIAMLSISMLFGLSLSNGIINAKSQQKTSESNNIMETANDYEYKELTYEEYVQAVSEAEHITYSAAEARVNLVTRGNARAATYGEFSRYYDLYDAALNSYKIKYGVLATWYSPGPSEPWSSRKWMTIHATLLEPGNNVKGFTYYSKNATITSNYIINYYASVKYYIFEQSSKSGTINDIFSI
ncbi:hypothetical protein MKA27_19640 [[Clostridium] innocuum]|uniref:hypothetical protein n=1 Tax=Clostridium innocuum TaxID=1522 RepID=UPI000D6CF127|nr:hypothetical protein [[Clostridium] innocuum]MCR0316604.1 hypothetical protein [[Clostridium] innocuum]MCR0371930.1 hypothetical protein [[Clostridium] innocuum]MCR0376003.1 hypothetical protein [[Clostridium] innocuum]MCR0561254.1 hypothetical protein [[Clostridium] innocuum]MCR0604540.1 hypothetical protein [[Clostridium] innocuum]